MRLRFPYTPTMRYERMAVCLVATVFLLAFSVQFSSMSLLALGEFLHTSSPVAGKAGLRLLALLVASTAATASMVGFLLLALIKIESLQAPNHLRLVRVLHHVATALFYLTMFLAVALGVLGALL